MTTENQLSLIPMEEQIIKEFNMTDVALAEIQAAYMPLTITDINDKEGYKKVREARIYVKNKRGEVETKRVELKADALKYERAVDAEAKRITKILREVENHLDTQQRAIDTEKERLKAEEKRKEDEKLQARVSALQQWNASVMLSVVMKASDEEFEGLLNQAKLEWEAAEKVRQEELEKERVAEEARQAEDAKKAEEESKRRIELNIEAQRLADERKAIEEEKAALARQKEAEAEREREKMAVAQKQKEEETKAEEEKAFEPDRAALHKLANELHLLQYPEMATEHGKKTLEKARSEIGAIYSWLFSL